jgi:hypothetical protein
VAQAQCKARESWRAPHCITLCNAPFMANRRCQELALLKAFKLYSCWKASSLSGPSSKMSSKMSSKSPPTSSA